MNVAQAQFSSDGVTDVVERIFKYRRITRADQQLFMRTLLGRETLSPEDRSQIDRVFDAVQSGLIRIVD